MKQFPRPAQASRKYLYFFVGLISLVVLMDLAGGVRSVDSKRSAAEAKEKKQRELAKALFVDRVVSPPQQPKTASATSPIAPLANPTSCSAGSSTSASCLNSTGITASDKSQGVPYASIINVSGMSGNVTNVTLVLHGVNSTTDLAPAQFLLTAPNGTKLVFLAGDNFGNGGGGAGTKVNATITIDDAAGTTSGCNSTALPLTTHATACGAIEHDVINGFPTVCTISPLTCPLAQPLGSGPAATMATFHAEPSGNGSWTLYTVNNGAVGNSETFTVTGGWTLNITTSGVAAAATTTSVSPANTSVSRTPPAASSPATITATVDTSPHSAINAGTVSFFDNGNAVSCNAGSSTVVTGNTFSCILTFTQEGIHPITATYNGTSGFAQSSSPAGTPANVTVSNTTTASNVTATGGTYCNVGTILIPSSGIISAPAAPYPSQVFVGSNGGPALPGVITNLTVDLKAIHHTNPNASQLLLVSPNSTAYILFSDAYTSGGAQGPANITLSDAGGSQIPNSGGFSSGTFRPADYHTNASEDQGVFTPPAPQSGFLFPNPIGSGLPAGPTTIGQAFNGGGATGTWQLFVFQNSTGSSGAIDTGWCLNFTVNPNLHASTTTTSASPIQSYTSSPFTSQFPPAPANDFVTLTAHITSDISVTTGSVTFTENGSSITCGNGTTNPATVNGSGDAICKSTNATFTTEGNHIIKATYHDAGGTFGDSNQNTLERVDSHSTRSPAANTISATTTYTYCNPAQIRLPAFGVAAGPGNPYPSNIFINDLPGTINKVTLSVPNFQSAGGGIIQYLSSLLVGNNRTITDSLDLFSHVGQLSGLASPINFTLDDAGASNFTGADPTSGTFKPTSISSPTYSASTYPSLSPAGPYAPPSGTPQYAAPTGAFTFASVYGSGPGNTRLGAGTWSLFQEMFLNSNPIFEGNGTNVASWCLNFTINPPVVSMIKADVNPPFAQGQQGAQYTFVVHNAGPGPTGGLLAVTDTLPAGLTFVSGSGTNWSCSAVAQVVTCTSNDAIAAGSDYPTITVNVNVAFNAATAAGHTVSNTAAVAGGGAVGSVNSNTLITTVTQLPELTISKADNVSNATFGTPWNWTLTVSNIGFNNAAFADQQVILTDPLPSSNVGYTTVTPTAVSGITNFGNISCGIVSNTLSCKANGATVTIAAAGSFTVQFTATPTATGVFTNPNGTCSVDPNNNVLESIENDNTSNSDTVTVTKAAQNYVQASGNCSGNTPCFSSITSALVFVQTPGTTHVLGGVFNESVNLNQNSTLSIEGATTVNAFTLTSGTLNGGSSTLTLASGNWTNNGGTFNPGTGTVAFGGTGQTIGGSVATTFNGLTVGSGGTILNLVRGDFGTWTDSVVPAVLSVDATVNGVLTLNGDLTVTSPATLIQPSTAPASVGTGDVVGNYKRTGASLPNSALTYGNPDNVITLAGSSLTSLTVNLTKSAPTSTITGIANSGWPGAVQRTYIITELPTNGFTPASTTVQLHYLTTELNGNSEATAGPPASLRLYRYVVNNPGTGWQQQDVGGANTTLSANHFVRVVGIKGFSPWTIAGASPTAATSTVSGRITDTDGNPVEGAVIHLSGTQERKTITDSQGNYSFAEVETNGFYTVTPSRVNYNFAPATRGFSALGAHTDASFAGALNGNHLNPLDTTEYFVRQQYVDFLGREPEEKGFNDWTDTINNCASGDTSCDRVHVSEAFVRSDEFQQRGYFVYRFYSTAFGQKPDYTAFVADLGRVSGFLDASQLEAAKTQFAIDFTARGAFMNQYGTLSNSAYVDALSQTAGVTLSNRQALVDSLSAGTMTRAQALRQIAESGEVYSKYYNQAFVVMEYFGYLRRDPDLLYLNWISVLDANPADSRRMVEGFVDATEYRNRFKQ